MILFEKKMCKSWCQPFNLGAHHYFDFKRHGSWVEFLAASCFVFVCLFVFQLPRWVIILFLSLTSGWGFLVLFVFVLFCCCCCCFFFFVLFCFVLFFLQNVQFPHHISRVRLIYIFFFLSHRLVKFFCFLLFLFVCFFFILFCFVFASKNSTPFDIKWCALFLILLHRWWWTGHYVIDNFEFPCNSVKNLIPIWYFTIY